jgi:hypothetical protein
MSATIIDTRAVFALRLRYVGKPAENGVHNLCALLKQLRRRGFVCLDAREESQSTQTKEEKEDGVRATG